MRDPTASRLASVLRRDAVPIDDADDDGLAAWCDAMDLDRNGRPLPAMELARRAVARQRAEANVPPREIEQHLPFHRRSYTRDL